ncbi:MAG: hypothetical protein LBR26_12135, partial [Prevotella sp.]|nr:hypothetical protein [Prevotella sp.]
RNDKSLTDLTLATSAADYKSYTGDICQYLSVHKSASGLSGNWVMPTSNNFGPVPTDNQYGAENSVYEKYNDSHTTAGSEDGAGGDLFGVKLSYVLNDSSVSFPASGYRDNYNDGTFGSLYVVGEGGYYWSSSALGETNAYGLGFYSGLVYPAFNNYFRTNGQSVRCVVDRE